MTKRIVTLALCLASTAVFAQTKAAPAAPAPVEAACRSLSDIVETARLAHVAAPKGQALLKTAGKCPADTAECRQKLNVTAKDVVLAGPATDGYACAAIVSSKGTPAIGYLPAASITYPAIPARDWLGKWTAPQKTIRIRQGDGTAPLRIEGDATYGETDPAKIPDGVVKSGNFTVDATPEGNVVRFGSDSIKEIPYDENSDDCMVRIAKAGGYLVVVDNNACGARNVTFTGIYKLN